MKRILPLAFFLSLLAVSATAQQVYNSSGRRGNSGRPKQKGGFDASRVIFGGGVVLNFGQVTAIGASPILGYRISNRFAAGIGLAYQYVRVKDEVVLYDQAGQQQGYPLKQSFVAPSVWGRFLFSQRFFAHTELEADIQTYRYYDYDRDYTSSTFGRPKQFKEQYTSPAWLVGLGYRMPVASNSSLVALVLYDVIQDQYSPYRRRLDFRIGFNVGW